jgi:hypothetical protein
MQEKQAVARETRGSTNPILFFDKEGSFLILSGSALAVMPLDVVSLVDFVLIYDLT